MQAMRKSTQTGASPVAAKHLLQHREDVVDLGSDSFRLRGRLAFRPQVIDVLDERRAEPQAHLLGIRHGPDAGRAGRSCRRHRHPMARVPVRVASARRPGRAAPAHGRGLDAVGGRIARRRPVEPAANSPGPPRDRHAGGRRGRTSRQNRVNPVRCVVVVQTAMADDGVQGSGNSDYTQILEG